VLDFQPWNQWLQQYVDEQGRVDYAAWKQTSEQDLSRWLEVMSQQEVTLAGDDRAPLNQSLALWLNLYNALVIQQVLQQYPMPSIRPRLWGIPNWIAFLRFFSRPIYQFNHKPLSLNAIEHGILRPEFNEPRIHFALVCAAIGCPLLRNEAYAPERVQAQLEEDATRFMNNPTKVNYDESMNILYCSQIFKWYRQDFLKTRSSIPAYVQTYYAKPVTLTDSTPIRYLPYDWGLNQRTSS
jgi:hypothetical protein